MNRNPSMTAYQEAMAFFLDPSRVTLNVDAPPEKLDKLARKYAAGWKAQASSSMREPTRYPVPKWARVNP